MKTKTIIKEALALFAITLVAALLLGFVYEVTKEPIKEQKALQKQKACQTVFLDANQFTTSDTLERLTESATEALIQQDFNNIRIDEILEAKSEAGDILGHVMIITTKEGYAADIVISLGIKVDGTVNGIEILSISETAGLGAKAADDDFKNQFSNKNIEVFTYTKTGKSAENEIDAISGATITTNAVTNAVNAGIYYINSYVKGN